MRPKPPPPQANRLEVTLFLEQFFLHLDYRLSQADAEARATKMALDGISLYETPLGDWMNVYGFQGKIIYYELQNGEYDFV